MIVRQYYIDRTKEPPLLLNLVRVDSQAPSIANSGLSRDFSAQAIRRVVSNIDVRSGRT